MERRLSLPMVARRARKRSTSSAADALTPCASTVLPRRVSRGLLSLLGVCAFLGVYLGLTASSVSEETRMSPGLDDVMLDLKMDRVRDVWTDETFQCLGWRATSDCNPSGRRDLSGDRSCDTAISSTMAGYCEVRNRSSGATFHVMATTCRSIDDDVVFTCNMARDFTDFSLLAAAYKEPPHIAFDMPASPPANGIVMSVYEDVLPSAYAVVRTLRRLGCKLHVELWYRREQIDPQHPLLQELVAAYQCTLREIFEPTATHFHTKPYAIYYSAFQNVLFLDSDNIPAKDPTYLFESREFVEHGAVFWPDFWHPRNTLFNLQPQSLLWQALDMPYIDMIEQESGQLLINKVACLPALRKLMFYSGHAPRLLDALELVWGDKDLYRLAWLNTSTPFYMQPRLPAIGGLYDPSSGYFCGVAMLQFDAAGDVVFVHRNTVKLTGHVSETPVLSHMQTFTGDAIADYVVSIQGNRMGQSSCFFLTSKYIVTPVKDTPFATLEETAMQFAIEGAAAYPRREHDHRQWLSHHSLLLVLVVLAVFGFANVAMLRMTTRRFWLQQFRTKRKNSVPVV
ncbi:hypothetical protein SPRG_20078 [Saprolegnia parasitica CBS 223.65]|uniref:Uncharacterized protein n=1 Tax=Saprolegnia parasitica (strain CBS 223.65) TaxID=695850 RepID=A0A067CEN4_SAPPC|nr:hypothetical protein SPRG_20078 [Saprolegnia parasitica CBS 223.65]KDO28973.1 hypothetical protein SPRG_20078 [Saprolegnia parasitica CBS 223.65]|eukprot:XP_012200309.1 hypothetical protein SPRG_20078 [Saprolegnia parasitica CBS 223.65]